MKRVALMVGVDRYEDNAFRDLRYSVADAAALAAAFGKHGFETHVVTNPGNQVLLKEVRRRTSELGPGDVFLFFFAGHGYTGPGGEHLLICSDDSLEFLRHNRAGVPVDMLEELTNGKGYHRAFLLDACRTDVFSGQEMRGAGMRDLGLVSIPDAGKNPGTCCVLRSCDRFCPALEFEDLGHGVFTRAVLDFLEGSSGLAVQMGEAFATGVRNRMWSILKREGSMTEQNPTFQTNGPAFPLIVGGAGEPAPVAEPPKAATTELPSSESVGNGDITVPRTDGEGVDPFQQKVKLKRELQAAVEREAQTVGAVKSELEQEAWSAIRTFYIKGERALREGRDFEAQMRFSEAEQALRVWKTTWRKRRNALSRMKQLQETLEKAGKARRSKAKDQAALASIRDLFSAGEAAFQAERYEEAEVRFAEMEQALKVLARVRQLDKKLEEAGKDEDSTAEEQTALASIRDSLSTGATALQTDSQPETEALFTATEKALEKWKEEKAKRQTDEHAEELRQWDKEKWRVKWMFAVGAVMALSPILLFILFKHGFNTAFMQTGCVWPWCWWHLKLGMLAGIAGLVLVAVASKLYLPGEKGIVSKKVYAEKIGGGEVAFGAGVLLLWAAMLLFSIFCTFGTLGFSFRAIGVSIFYVVAYFAYFVFESGLYLIFNALIWHRDPTIGGEESGG